MTVAAQPETTVTSYKAYLQTDHWKALRETRLRIAGFRCERVITGYRCESRYHLQVHHTFYRDTWFETQVGDLRVRCEYCHKKEHNLVQKPDHHYVSRHLRNSIAGSLQNIPKTFSPGMYETGPFEARGRLPVVPEKELASQRRLSNRQLLREHRLIKQASAKYPFHSKKLKVNRELEKTQAPVATTAGYPGAVSRGGNAAIFSPNRNFQSSPLPSNPQFRAKGQPSGAGQPHVGETSKPVTSASPSADSISHGPSGASSRPMASVAQSPRNTVPSVHQPGPARQTQDLASTNVP